MSSIGVLEAAVDAVCDSTFDELNNPEVLAALARLEIVQRRLTSVGHTLMARMAERGSPVELGGTSFPDVLSRRLRISKSSARRRLADAEQLAPRVTMSGECLEPHLPCTAQALRSGAVGDEHVRIVRGFFDRLPGSVDIGTRVAAEERLAEMASKFGPEQLRVGADRIMALINPDGELCDADRARRRGLSIGRQGPDGMSAISGLLDPETRACLDAVLSKWAAPGMCDPSDQTPTVDGDAAPDAAARDARTPAQRNHDALRACLRSALASGELGSHHGLPVTVVVSTTLSELESASGSAVTGGGTLLPMSDLIRMATHAHHYLAVFDGHDDRPLYLGRTKRIASRDQRVVLHARDRGCTAPGCKVPGYLCEVHHVQEWAADGPTDIDRLVFACGPHHRLLEQGWSTRKRRSDGLVEWIPPPHLDSGQARTNDYHHPERFTLDPQ